MGTCCRFDSDSELSGSESSCSSADLTDVDPRIAQLATGRRDHPQLCNVKSNEQELTIDSPSDIPESPLDNNSTFTHTPSSGNDALSLKDPKPTPSTISNSPPKPPRLSADDLSKVPSDINLTQSADYHPVSSYVSRDDEVLSAVEPYSIVDTSCFKDQPSIKAAKSKGKTNPKHMHARECKPPIPKSAPPQKSTTSMPRELSPPGMSYSK